MLESVLLCSCGFAWCCARTCVQQHCVHSRGVQNNGFAACVCCVPWCEHLGGVIAVGQLTTCEQAPHDARHAAASGSQPGYGVLGAAVSPAPADTDKVWAYCQRPRCPLSYQAHVWFPFSMEAVVCWCNAAECVVLVVAGGMFACTDSSAAPPTCHCFASHRQH